MTEVTINGQMLALQAPATTRLSDALRDELGLTGTKIGCNAGDCGACTVLLDGRQACACLVLVGQVAGATITTIEGLNTNPVGRLLQQSFHRHGAAQCGICTPGMLIAAFDLLGRDERPGADAIEAALGGVLCRCTGYRKIIAAVAAAASGNVQEDEQSGAMGTSIPRLDGARKVDGTERFGADQLPEGCLHLRLIRSPYHHARFKFRDLAAWQAQNPGIVHIFRAADVPGRNGYGVYPDLKDQPVLAETLVRHRGEPVLAILGSEQAISAIDPDGIPIAWEPLPARRGFSALEADSEPPLHARFPDNVLARGRVLSGDPESALANSRFTAHARVETCFVEHAYIEPEAGIAVRKGERIEIAVSTQTPYMDLEEVAAVLGIEKERVRIIPTACGGGFGGKLDAGIQPVLAVAAWLSNRPVRCVLSRPESMASSPKRHPARIEATMGCNARGHLTGIKFHGDFNSGAYASWGPTVASRVPVHATGPYRVQAAQCTTRGFYSNDTPAGAFRGFGVPQSAIVHEALMDRLADKAGIDRFEFRRRNALRNGDVTHCGQSLASSVGMVPCLDRLEPIWRREWAACEARNVDGGPVRAGIGIGCMWYGLGNTSMSNPSSMEVGLKANGRLTLYNGAVDIGQGSATIMVQLCAEALGLPAALFDQVLGDTDLTLDAGKTSASRQTLVSGNAARLAGMDLRDKLLRLANAGPDARLSLAGSELTIEEGGICSQIALDRLASGADGDLMRGQGNWDPPTTALDANGRGEPYAAYGFAAQLARVAVDVELGTVNVEHIWAAHDIGKAINPVLVEGQIEGGIAQGLGLALMEEFIPGVNENLHDYLIPTIGDVPPIEVFLIDADERLGPFGAKGVGEPALIATAPAIFGAIDQATGIRPTKVPLTPSRLLDAIRKNEAN